MNLGFTTKGYFNNSTLLNCINIMSTSGDLLARKFFYKHINLNGVYVTQRLYFNGVPTFTFLDDSFPCLEGLPLFAECKKN